MSTATATSGNAAGIRRGEAAATFRHECLLHRGDGGFLAATLPHVLMAIEAGRGVLIAVSERRIGLLRQALGADAAGACFVDVRELGANPARIIPAWRELLDAHDGHSVLGIGEPVWPGRRAEELRECHLHESLLNAAFDGGVGWELFCPYDVDGLDADTVASAHRSHPRVSTGGRSRASDRYDPARATLELALSPPAPNAFTFPFTVRELCELRSLLAVASASSLDERRTQDLILAANELATNSVTHGGGAGTLRLWTDGDELVCEIHDHGHLTDALAGCARPGERQLHGRGLWIVNQLCDLVQIHASAEGTTVRVRMSVQGASS